MTLSRRHFLETSVAALVAAGAVTVASPAFAQGAYDLTEMLKPGPLPEMTIGKDDAPITIVEYASMTCSHCAHFHETVLPYLKATYLDTGKARLVFREFPLDPLAAAVSMLARCSPSDKYFEMTGLFFEKQASWIQTQDPVAALRNLTKQLGFTQETFEACLRNQKLLDDISAVRKRGADDYKIDGTPTFFINGRKIVGIGTTEELDKALAPYLK